MSEKPGGSEIEKLAVAKAEARLRQMECNARRIEMLFKAEAAIIRSEIHEFFLVRSTALRDELLKTVDNRLSDLLTRKLGEAAVRHWQELGALPAVRTAALRDELLEDAEVIRQEMRDLCTVRSNALEDELMTILNHRLRNLVTKYETMMDSLNLCEALPKSLLASS